MVSEDFFKVLTLKKNYFLQFTDFEEKYKHFCLEKC